MVGAESPPRLILNDHCQVCEFRQRCHDQAVQEDNISLLRGMGEKEIKKLCQEGHLHRHPAVLHVPPQEEGRRAEVRRPPHSPPCRRWPSGRRRSTSSARRNCPPPVRIYFDIEGDPERGFDYLLGMIV